MNKNIYIVNNRCITLCVFVFILILHINANVAFADVSVPTDPPEMPIPTPTLSRTDYLLEQEENKFLDDSYGGYRSNFEKSIASTKKIQRSMLETFFSALGGVRSTASTFYQTFPTLTPTNDSGNSSSSGITSTLQGLIPAGDPPPGRCSNLVSEAVARLKSNPSNLDIYRQASAQTGVPWEAIAAIHYIETGGNFNPNGSCISGRAIGQPEPDNGNQRYSSLLETCIAAAKEFEGKKAMVNFVVGKNSLSAPNAYEMLAGQFASYNSPTQSECAMGVIGKDNYDFVYTGATWPGIPDNGQCRPKGEKFVGDRHIYSTACLDTAHESMYFHFHFGGNVIKYENRVGALTLIRAIQKEFSNNASGQSNQTYPAPTGYRRSPADAEIITKNIASIRAFDGFRNVEDSCAVSVNRTNVAKCIDPLINVTTSFKDIARRSASSSFAYLQCVGYAYALASEINGSVPNSPGYGACQLFKSSNYGFIPYTGNATVAHPGDMILWNSPGNLCNPSTGHYGHIAYIIRINDPRNILVSHANWGTKGSISIKTFDLSSYSPIGFIRKL